MLGRWRAVGYTVSSLTAGNLILKLPAPQTNALPLDQLAGFNYFDITLIPPK